MGGAGCSAITCSASTASASTDKGLADMHGADMGGARHDDNCGCLPGTAHTEGEAAGSSSYTGGLIECDRDELAAAEVALADEGNRTKKNQVASAEAAWAELVSAQELESAEELASVEAAVRAVADMGAETASEEVYKQEGVERQGVAAPMASVAEGEAHLSHGLGSIPYSIRPNGGSVPTPPTVDARSRRPSDRGF